MFINFRTVSCGPKKRSGSCDVWILWFFGKDKHGQTHEIFREFPLRWGFIGRHLGNMQEEEHLPSPFGMGVVSVSRWTNLVPKQTPHPCHSSQGYCNCARASLLSSTSTWFFSRLIWIDITDAPNPIFQLPYEPTEQQVQTSIALENWPPFIGKYSSNHPFSGALRAVSFREGTIWEEIKLWC